MLAVSLFPCAQWAVGNGPVGAFSADFDGDGHVDLAVANEAADTVSILLNAGGGLFEPAVEVAVGGGPVSIAGADFDGDEDVDLAVVNGTDDNVSVLLNDGAGGFAAPTNYTVGADPAAVVAADLNGDDIPDLAAASAGSDEVAVAFGDGAGGFVASVAYAVGDDPRDVTVADLDDDGDPDLLTVDKGNTMYSTVSTLLNDGAGGFTLVGSYLTGPFAEGIAVADFNEDGALDVMTTYLIGVSLLLGGGDGTLGPDESFSFYEHTLFHVNAVAAADVNADGHADMVVALEHDDAPDSLSVRLGHGDGTFGGAVRRPAGDDPVSPQVADFDGNGILDVAVANNATGTVTVLEGHGDGTFGGRRVETSEPPIYLFVGDLNNDGHLDLAALNTPNGRGTIGAHLGQGDGTFGEPVESTGLLNQRTLTGADVDGDGLVDLFVGCGYSTTGDEIYLLRNLGGGAFDAPTSIYLKVGFLKIGVGYHPIQVVDLDLDGHLDIVASDADHDRLAVVTGNGDGTFQIEPLLLTVGDDPQAVWAGDFNADDWPDLACVNTSSDTVSILFNTGNGTLDADTFGAPVDYAAGDAPRALFGDDFNQDGAIDLATANQLDGSVSVLLNHGDGTFAAPTDYPVGFVASPAPNGITGADLNGDGHLDLAVSNDQGDALSVFLGLGDGVFQPARQFAGGAEPRAITAADFNEDDRLDLAVADFADESVQVLIQRPLLWHSEIVSPRRSCEIVEGDALRFAGEGAVAVGPISYAWDFGDGRTSALEAPGMIAFRTPGVCPVSFAVVDGNAAADLAPDTRTITVVADDGTMPDLALIDVAAPAALGAGHVATVDYEVRNDGDGGVTGATWVDALYLSDDPYVSQDDLRLASVDVAVDLAAGESYSRSMEFTVPGVEEGVYYLIMSVDDDWQVLELHQLNNELAPEVPVGVPELHDGAGVDSRFVIDSRMHHYRVEIEAGEHFVVVLDDADDQGVNELYLSHREVPTRVAYDYRHGRPGEADQSIVVASPAPGTWYVLAYGLVRPGADDYTILADMTGVALGHVGPGRLGTTSLGQIALDGAGFGPTTQVELLEPDGTPHAASAIDVESPTRIVATFDTGAVPAGLYGVRVSEPGGDTAQLDDVLEIVPGTVSYFETNLILPAVVGYHQLATLYVEYANTGEVAMPAPLMHLTAEQEGRQAALLSLEQSGLTRGLWTSALPEGFSNSVQLLASGEQPGVLQPGESMRVPVYYVGWQQPWDFNYPPIDWRLTWIGADSDLPLDWDSHKEGMQPDWAGDEAWEPIWANFIDQAGTTWGEYVTLLADNASHLGGLGERIADVPTLLGFELQQADGLSPVDSLGGAVDAVVSAPGLTLSFTRSFAASIADRYETGPFGRGWSHNWQSSLAVSADGTVAIQEPARPPRVFQPDRRGGYLASPGDYSTLEAIGGGAFTLTDVRGTVVAYRADGNLDYTEDTNGNRITATYTGGLLTRLTHSSGQWIELAYNAAGRIERLTDSAGGEVTYAYDAGDEHLLSVGYDDGRAVNYTYSTGEGAAREHALTGILQACGCGGNQYFTYDAHGRLASTHREGGAELITYDYDSAGTITATDAAGGATRLLFDHRGLLGQVIDANGHATTSAYSGLHGRTTSATDSLGRAYTYDYDTRGRLVRVTDPLGNATEYTYTGPPDRLASVTDAHGNAIEYSYDARGNLLSAGYEDNTVESYTYDAVGNVDTWTNRRGETVDFEYDAAGRVTAKIYPESSRIDYTYDAYGNLTSAADAAGSTVLEYDANDYLWRITCPDGQWIQFTYTATGQRASVTDSFGSQVHYAYDALGRLEELTDAVGDPIAHYTYDAAGRLERKDLGSGIYTTYDYDPAGQLLGLVNYGSDDSVLSRFDYAYDALGQCTSMTTLDGDWTYQYDYVGQLVGAQFQSTTPGIPDQDLAYEYDPLGNRIRTIVNGETTDYTTNDINQYEAAGDTTYEYDDDGNLTRKTTFAGTTTYTYDIENRLVRVETATDTWDYVYDALGSRVATVHNDTETNYLVDPIGLDNVIAEYDAAGDLLTAYHHAYDGLIARTDDAGGAQYYTFDGLGSTAELTDASGNVLNQYVFDPFGLPLHTAEAVPNDFEFLGEWGITATGHGDSFMRARYYDPVLGRFHAQDPLGLDAGDVNLYRYVANNPVSRIDPSGAQGGDEADEGEIIYPDNMLCYRDCTPVWYDADECEIKKFYFVDAWCKHDFDTGKAALMHCRQRCEPVPDPPPPPPSPPEPPEDEDDGNGDGDGGAGGSSGTSGSVDPNQKLGPAGFGQAHYVAEGRLLGYRIDFENDPAATAPAQYVSVTDRLARDLDWSTFELTEVGFGDHFLAIPPGTQSYETVAPMTSGDTDFELHVEIGFDTETGLLEARFMSLDPETGLPPDVTSGFLPPEDGTGRGQGHFSYVIEQMPGLPSGTEIRNIAVIQFDFGETIATNQVDPHDPGQGTDPAKEALVTIDAGAPESNVLALDAVTITTTFSVEWAGQDDAGGSGVGSCDVYVSDDGADYVLWLDDTPETSAEFTGEDGHTYAFYSVATDNVGHREAAPSQSDAQTTLDLPATAYMQAVLRAADAGLPADPNGEAEVLPESLEWIDEWDSFWIEIWGRTPDTDDYGIGSFSVDLLYNTDLFTATTIQYGPAFTEDQAGAIDDPGGRVDEIGAATQQTDVGDNQNVLLARVFFEPTAADPGCPHNADQQYITPVEDLGLAFEEAGVELVGVGQSTVEIGTSPETEPWPVMYDVDDDGQVGFGDLAFFATAFQQKVGDPGADFAWACDFDHSGKADVGDLAFFAENFQRTPGSPMVYPANFPDDWHNGTQGAAALMELPAAGMQESPAAESLQAADRESLNDSVLESYSDRLDADSSRTRLSNDLLGYACCLLDFDTAQATSSSSSGSNDSAEAVDLLLATGYW